MMLVQIWRLIREGIEAYVNDEALTRGAAIAFYAVTAVAPILFITLRVASMAFGADAARGAIATQLRHIMSRESADLLQLAVGHGAGDASGLISTVISVLALILTASGVFGEMEDALNAVWRAPRKGSVVRRLIRGRAISLMLVIGLGFLLIVSMFFTAAITALGPIIDRHPPFSVPVLALINWVASTALLSILFAAIYKILPNKKLEWRDVGAGAIGTALLFQVGQFLLGYYLGSSAIAVPYGVAGGLIVLLIWVYYSAQVFLLGAEFTKVFSRHYGSQQGLTSA